MVHSDRGSSSSVTADSGITTITNLKEANWSTEFMFRSFIVVILFMVKLHFLGSDKT